MTTIETIETLYQAQSRRVFATLVRILGDFDLAEDAMHEAFGAALEKWPNTGIPENPVAWLVSTGRFKAIDTIRRGTRFQSLSDHEDTIPSLPNEPEVVGDEVLRLIFTCCHPALSADAQIALTLREVCELTTEEIAHAFLTPVPTLAQRIVRAKAKIRDAQIPFEIPSESELGERLGSVLKVIYLVYNEGYSASSGKTAIRRDLVQEAIRLTRLVASLLPDAEVFGLLALMLLQEARRATRTTSNGDLIPLDEQDRSQWNLIQIEEGSLITQQALRTGHFGAYTLQAAISAVHAEATAYEETDWEEIVGLYDALLRIEPSSVVQLNRAVAVAMHQGSEQGLVLVEHLLVNGGLQNYHLAHAARADLCNRLGRFDDAIASYLNAIQLAQQEPEKRFLHKQIEKIERNRK
jgi:RNA polymerase sigma-70 factor (ECF subfamily)